MNRRQDRIRIRAHPKKRLQPLLQPPTHPLPLPLPTEVVKHAAAQTVPLPESPVNDARSPNHSIAPSRRVTRGVVMVGDDERVLVDLGES